MDAHKPRMIPEPGGRLLRFVGDFIRITLRGPEPPLPGCRAFLRTNLGKESAFREEIIATYAGRHPLSVAFWRDVPLKASGENEWTVELPLLEPGFFHAKAYLVDAQGRQHWPDGPDLGISIHPDAYRAANTIYCAFTRMFGETRGKRSTRDPALDSRLGELDDLGYAVIPPSGKFRDLTAQLPHIMGTLGCRILHLLPVGPTPAAFARMGRFGSPYACLDLTMIDPALVEFDQRTTGVEQFGELAYAVHARGGRLLLDMVINHTGWGSTLHETHPEWFLRLPDGRFASPGAWGVVWEDLVELSPHHTGLWEHLAEAFLTWCQRGVDGFRCDAGYKVPVPVWKYIEARVRREFPNTIFLLEGLGGSWEATETLLTDGGMQWAYSELFQNYSGEQIATYLDYSFRQSERVGVLVHYSETHDNERLAKKGRRWSLLRNRLSALASVNGAFGFTCGVEWLADEKIEVHESRGMNWGARENIVSELAQINGVLAGHPCFFDGARLERLSAPDSPVYALRRDSAEGADSVLVLVNTDIDHERRFVLAAKDYADLGGPQTDLFDEPAPVVEEGRDAVTFLLPPGAAYCLSSRPIPEGLGGTEYRRQRAGAAWAMSAMRHLFLPEEISRCDWRELARRVSDDPRAFLGAISHLETARATGECAPGEILAAATAAGDPGAEYLPVVTWTLADRRRITPVPPDHWLLLHDTTPFRATLALEERAIQQHAESIETNNGHAAFFPPMTGSNPGSVNGVIHLERYALTDHRIQARLRFLASGPHCPENLEGYPSHAHNPVALLTNGLGGMARIPIDLGRVFSKYDCVLGANLHPEIPIDRHVFVKRVRVWANASGFITPLDANDLARFEPGPPAVWQFVANAGDGRSTRIQMTADMIEGRNTTWLAFAREEDPLGPAGLEVRLTVRFDIEDRGFHSQTHHNGGADHHFSAHTSILKERPGFLFAPAHDRRLRVYSSKGSYHPQPEWSLHLQHPVEQGRGQVGHGDAYSPGWFDLPLAPGETVIFAITADRDDPPAERLRDAAADRQVEKSVFLEQAALDRDDRFGRRLALAARAFVAKRGSGKTVIAGYPWFLDWGRDSLICARGLLSAGMISEVTELLVTFGRFVEDGTMPNTIHGEDASNRNTSDAPLWYGVVCAELARLGDGNIHALPVDRRGRIIADVLGGIAAGYMRGTPNGIRMDPASGLIWSPSHFTWMDTNFPAGTPREGYPVEIQVLWICLLRELNRLGVLPVAEPWGELAARAEGSLHRRFWLEDCGYLSDVLLAPPGRSAAEAVADTALRSNFLFAISFGLLTGDRARRGVEMAARHLVVPGALRSLAPLPVSPPLPVHGGGGRLLNNPEEPYWGHYEGDEDTSRKPAYHNGTAWTWTFPTFCEALACAWDFSPAAVAAARAYLGSMDWLLGEGCIGHIPEILDGDAPHQQRGCDAQAWGATEALRVWKRLQRASGGSAATARSGVKH